VILSNHIGPGWEGGRFGIERKCDCAAGRRSAECHTVGWHLVASSDDRGDALSCARELCSFGGVAGRTGWPATHRVVDQSNYETISIETSGGRHER
jgi:hypothetical protein